MRPLTINLFLLLLAKLIVQRTRSMTTYLDENTSARSLGSNLSKRKWITQLFDETKDKFLVDSRADSKCGEDFHFYLEHLRNHSVWAVRMLESAEWPSVGLLAGDVDHLGNYDECTRISIDRIKGQYCLAQATFDYDNLVSYSDPIWLEEPNDTSSVWDALKMYQNDPFRVTRNRLKFALCVPSSCTPFDLETSLGATLHPTFRDHGIDISIQVDPIHCSIRTQNYYSQGYHVTQWILISLIALAVASTGYDIVYNGSDPVKRCDRMNIYASSSIIRNYNNLIRVQENYQQHLFHFFKTVFTISVIYFHRRLYFVIYSTKGTEFMEQILRNSIEGNFLNVIDVLILITGYVTFQYDYTPRLKPSMVSILKHVLFRWMRMIPVYFLLSLYLVYILPYTGDGPLWKWKINEELDHCKSWWVSLLALQNIYPDRQCIPISWYIGLDLQLSIVGAILLQFFRMNEHIGVLASSLVYVTLNVITFYAVYANNYTAVLRINAKLADDFRKEGQSKFYMATYHRAAPYIIGFLTAYLVQNLKRRKFKFSASQKITIFITSFVISVSGNMYNSILTRSDKVYDPFENAVYAATYRSLFVTVFVVTICIYFTSGLGLLNKLIDSKKFVVLGRLSYTVFLVHIVVMLYHVASQKQLLPTISQINVIWWTVADVIISYLIGLMLHLLAEAPVMNLIKILRNKLNQYDSLN